MVRDRPGLVRAVVDGTRRGYRLAASDPGRVLDDLLAGTNGLDRNEERAQLDALERAHAFVPPASFAGGGGWLVTWSKWEAAHGIVGRPPDLGQIFSFKFELKSAITPLAQR
jgi:hypothetical protein